MMETVKKRDILNEIKSAIGGGSGEDFLLSRF
jgi:hypothetical protein